MASDQVGRTWNSVDSAPARHGGVEAASSQPQWWERLALACGILFAVFVVVGVVAFPNGASSNDPPAKIVAYYAQHHSADLANDYLSFLAAGVFVVFLAGLSSWLRRMEGAGGMGTRLAFGAGLAGIVFEFVATAIEIALASRLYNLVSPDVVAGLFVVASRLFYTSVLFYGIFLAAASALLLRSKVLPRWLSWLGVAGSAVLILGSLAISDPRGPLGALYFIGFVLLLLWVLGTSIGLLRRTQSTALPQ